MGDIKSWGGVGREEGRTVPNNYFILLVYMYHSKTNEKNVCTSWAASFTLLIKDVLLSGGVFGSHGRTLPTKDHSHKVANGR